MSTIPALTGLHDGAQLIARRTALRAAYAQMLLKPSSVIAFGAMVHDALVRVHSHNVALFGWRDAEVIRAEAFAEAIEHTVPVGEATESDFGDLDGLPP